MPLGSGRATPAPLLSLDSGLVLQPRRLLSLLTQKCFICLPDPHVGRASRVELRFFAVVWVGRRVRVNTVLTQLLRAQVSSLGSGVHSPAPKIRQTPLCLTCCSH